MKKLSSLFIVLVTLACTEKTANEQGKTFVNENLNQVKSQLYDISSNYTLVIAHRGGVGECAPENSLSAIQYSIDIGADMVELDVRKTKDGILIIMHDETLDRTTTGKGLVADHTLAQLKELYLKDNSGKETMQKIPTFEEAMSFCKGKIMVNVDKADSYFPEVADVLSKTGTRDIALVKVYGNADSFKAYYDLYKDVHLMAVISLNRNEDAENRMSEFIDSYGLKIFELSFSESDYTVLDKTDILKNKGLSLWYTTTSPLWCAGHDDSVAITGDTDNSWGWLLQKNPKMILTDYPAKMIAFLNLKGLRSR